MDNVSSKLRMTFWATAAVFVLLIAFYIMVVLDLVPFEFFVFPLAGILVVLGIVLLIKTIKERVTGKLKAFLILTAVSAISLLLSIILHNFFYALAILTSNIAPLSAVFQFLEVAFFLLAIPVSPIAFLVGAIGTATLFLKK
jgi:hypothetical protein